MWSRFIDHYGGLDTNNAPLNSKGHVYTDIVTTKELWWGAWWFPFWIAYHWDLNHMQQNNYSIDFLELYAVLVAVWVWMPYFTNKVPVVHSDNQSMVQALHNRFSSSPCMLILLRFLTLHCILNNIHIDSQYVPASLNQIIDLLSCFQLSRFCTLAFKAERNQLLIPSLLLPFSKTTLQNLLLQLIGKTLQVLW